MSQPCCSGRGQQRLYSGSSAGPSPSSRRLRSSFVRLSSRSIARAWTIFGAAVEEELSVMPTSALAGHGDFLQGAGDGLELTPRRIMNRKLKGAHTLPELRNLILEEVANFDAANLAHAFGCLAKLYRSHSSRRTPLAGLSKQQALHECVMPSAQRLSEQMPRLLNDFEPWDTAQCLWAMSVLNWYDQSVFDLLCSRGSQQALLMKPADCAMTMLAFGRFGRYNAELLNYIPQVMLQELDQAKAADISAVLWGFAKLSSAVDPPSKVFMEAISDSLLWTIDQYGCQELINCLWAMATLHHYPGKSFLRAAEQKLLELVHLMNAQDIGNSLWAFGRLRYKAQHLLDELPHFILHRLPEFKTLELTCMLYGYTQARHYNGALLDAAAPVLMLRASQMSLQEITIALWTYGIFGHKPCIAGSAMSAAVTASAPAPALAPVGHEHASSNGAPAPHATPLAAAGNGTWHRGAGHERGTHHVPPDRPSSSHTSTPTAGLNMFVDALVGVLPRRTQDLRPAALSNIIKALASLRVQRPEVQLLARQVAQEAEARIHEFRPDEMSNLLYGLSLLRCNDLQVYHACVRQLLRMMEEPLGYLQSEWFNYKTLNSIVHSCVSAGYTPWTLIESAEVRGIRVMGNTSTLVPRWQQGHPSFASVRAARAVRFQALREQQQQHHEQQQHPQDQQSHAQQQPHDAVPLGRSQQAAGVHHHEAMQGPPVTWHAHRRANGHAHAPPAAVYVAPAPGLGVTFVNHRAAAVTDVRRPSGGGRERHHRSGSRGRLFHQDAAVHVLPTPVKYSEHAEFLHGLHEDVGDQRHGLDHSVQQ